MTIRFCHDLVETSGPYEGELVGGEFLVDRAMLYRIADDFGMTIRLNRDGSILVSLSPEDFDLEYRTDFDFLLKPQGEQPLYSVEFDGYTWIECSPETCMEHNPS